MMVMWGILGVYSNARTKQTKQCGVSNVGCLLNCLDEPVLMAGLKLLLTAFGIHQRLNCHESDSKLDITNVFSYYASFRL